VINSSNYNKIFFDLDLDMKKNEVTGDVKIRNGTSAVAQSIKNIVLTTPGERGFNPTFGFGMYDKLFELSDPVFIADIRIKMAAAINEQERRVYVDAEGIKITTYNESIEINISYTMKSIIFGNIGQKQSITITLTGNQ
jgi:phage baseplate assembly protein W